MGSVVTGLFLPWIKEQSFSAIVKQQNKQEVSRESGFQKSDIWCFFAQDGCFRLEDEIETGKNIKRGHRTSFITIMKAGSLFDTVLLDEVWRISNTTVIQDWMSPSVLKLPVAMQTTFLNSSWHVDLLTAFTNSKATMNCWPWVERMQQSELDCLAVSIHRSFTPDCLYASKCI